MPPGELCASEFKLASNANDHSASPKKSASTFTVARTWQAKEV